MEPQHFRSNSGYIRRQRAGTHCTTRSLDSAHAGSSSGLSTLMWAPDCSLICLMITPPLHHRAARLASGACRLDRMFWAGDCRVAGILNTL